MTPQKYALSSRTLHWLMALIIFTLLGLGIYMMEFLSKEAPNRMEIYSLHKSLGVLALILVLLRIINRFIKPAPKLPDTIAKFEKIAAHLGHFGLYFLMLLVPLSGYLMSNSFGFPVHLFSIEMPTLVQRDMEMAELFAETHEIAAYSLLGLVLLHILGALKHRLFEAPENDVLKRML